MHNRTKVINKLIADHGYESYLEIGVDSCVNFNNVNAKTKVGVDPAVDAKDVIKMESDEFFATNAVKFDLIFIDGLHHSDQVERDIANAYKALKKGGVVIIHDCKPFNEKMTRVPREQVQWTGDVYRAIIGFHLMYSDKIKTMYFDDEYGLYAIYKTGTYGVKVGFNLPDLTFEEFQNIKPY